MRFDQTLKASPKVDARCSSSSHSDAAEPAQGATVDKSLWPTVGQTLRTLTLSMLIALLLRTCGFETFRVEGSSMQPTLLDGDRVAVAKLYGLFLPLRRRAELSWLAPRAGEVVIIRHPATGIDIVKRVIGVGGDRIELHDDVVYRNGMPLLRTDRGACDMAGAKPSCRQYESTVGAHTFRTISSRFSADPPRPVVVPAQHIYVLGDHRDNSDDSRHPAVGVVPNAAVKGRVLGSYWSSGEDGVRWQRVMRPLS